MSWLSSVLAFIIIPIGSFLPAEHTSEPTKTTTQQQAPTTKTTPTKKVSGTSTKVTFSGGSYVLHVPPGDPPFNGWPWIVNYHGASWNGTAHEQQTGMSPLADEAGYVVIYPDAQGGRWDAGPAPYGCCAPATGHRNDVEWTRSMLSDAAQRTFLSPKGHTMGGSNGAMMAIRMQCEAMDLVEDTVMVAGAVVTQSCNGKRPKVLRLHSESDTTVPLCPMATTATPYAGCKGFENHVFFSKWKTESMLGPNYKLELFSGGHTWTPAQSIRAMQYFQTGV